MKIGITGASGNIGTTLRRGLQGKHELSLYDIRKISDAEVRCFKVDFAEASQVKGIFDGLDAIIHLAGDPWPNTPEEVTVRNNFLGTSNVFEEARRAGVKKIIYASSNFYHQGDVMTVLRGKARNRITLDMFPTPLCMYAMSKVYGENLGRHLAWCGMQFVALRIGWTVPEDSPVPYDSPYMRGIFISHRDLVQLVSLGLETSKDFVAAFGVSNNKRGIFDLTETCKALGYKPQDDSEKYF